MNDKLKCEVVRDLLPLYIEGLTSDVTKEDVEKHLSYCKECSKILDNMKLPLETEQEIKDIDYLKRIRMHSKRNLFIGILITIGIIFSFLFIKCYIIGFAVDDVKNYELMYSKVQPTNGSHIEKICFIAQGDLENRSMVFKQAQITKKENEVFVSLTQRLAFPWEDNNQFYFSHELSKEIKKIYLGDKVIWENGKIISEEVNSLYQTKHKYIGDMSANGSVAGALNIGKKFGSFKNSLKTSERPYGWTLEFDTPVTDEQLFNDSMKRYAYIILSLIDNLDELSWQYHNGKDGKDLVTITVTSEDATKAMNRDIKECAKSISELQRLIETLYL